MRASRERARASPARGSARSAASATRQAPTARAEPLSVWVKSFQSLSEGLRLQLLEIDEGLGAEELEHLALEIALAKRIARQMHEIDGTGGGLAAFDRLPRFSP